MDARASHSDGPFLPRLLRDRSGNTLAIIAAATAPLVAIVGSAVDIGRGYVAESRLQQACDAGTLAARKKLGSNLPPSGEVLGQVRNVGNDLFDLNFPEGRYDSTDLKFTMTLESDFAITGNASAKLPTVIMGAFGTHHMDIAVTCQSRMNFTNLDIMMVLDVTGSMRHTNAGDTLSRIDSMRSVITNFHSSIEAATSDDTRIRYGFVPYASNVNVGALLKNKWVVGDWTYQSREVLPSESNISKTEQRKNWTEVSGTRTDWVQYNKVAAVWNADLGKYVCKRNMGPANTWTFTDTPMGSPTTSVDEVAGVETTTTPMQRHHNGTRYRVRLVGAECIVDSNTDTDYVQNFDLIVREEIVQYRYGPVEYDVSSWRTDTEGCIEERDTYEIDDYENVDLTRALDLDINRVPDASLPSTQWRPRYPQHAYTRAIQTTLPDGGYFQPAIVETSEEYDQTSLWWLSACPAPAQKLKEMTKDEIATYLATLAPYGATYHDMGMVWGGRLLSQKGLFATENADVSGNKPTDRHLIFLTDGWTEPYDLAYTPYGLEPLDRRRWTESSTLSLRETVEKRFSFACGEVKKNDTTIWVIAFGTKVNESMVECAGPGHYFEAANADELDRSFKSIARSMGDLRISR